MMTAKGSDETKSAMLSVEQALATLLSKVCLLPTENVPLLEGNGRVLAKDAASDIDISPFDNTAMDGFAVRHADFAARAVSAENPLQLAIVGRIGAGQVYTKPLLSGEALRIMTGAPLPEGADTIVKIEDTQVLGVSASCPEGSAVQFTRTPILGEHVRPKGEEARKGQVLLSSGEVLNPANIGLLAATGHSEVQVYSRPRVAIISTGDELVDITTIPGPGQIRNSNSYSLAAQVLGAGGIPRIMPRAEDSLSGLAGSVKAALDSSDFIITSGGAGEGDFDFVAQVVRQLGELHFSKVNMKPGKAQVFGLINGTPLFGLSGNPGAASVGFEIIVRPALLKMQGFTAIKHVAMMAVVDEAVRKNDETRRLYLRARLSKNSKGVYHVRPDTSQSSALLGALGRSNCLLVVPEGDGSLAAGEHVKCIRLDVTEGSI